MTGRLHSYQNASYIAWALNDLTTMKTAGINVSVHHGSSVICRYGQILNTTIIMKAFMGNVPRLGLWTSMVHGHKKAYYSTLNTTDVLTLSTSDGRDDGAQVCNGLGSCNYTSGSCICAPVS